MNKVVAPYNGYLTLEEHGRKNCECKSTDGPSGSGTVVSLHAA